MVVLKNPEAPASSRQLYRIGQLTGRDMAESEMTMQEASDKIEELEAEDKNNEPPAISDGVKPFDEAHTTLVEGEQGSGKSATAVGMVIDSYRFDCVRIYCENILKMVCVVKGYDKKNRIAKVKHAGVLKAIRIPESYKLYSSMRIFANFHLYGIPYVYCPSFAHILKWLKCGLIVDGWLLMDEYYIGGNARDSMTRFGKALQKQGFQYRKMQLEVVIITPSAGLIDKTTRITPTKHILCSFNKETKEVELEIRRKGIAGVKTVPFKPSQYFCNFWTNERIND